MKMLRLDSLENRLQNILSLAVSHQLFCDQCQKTTVVCPMCAQYVNCAYSFENMVQILKQGKKAKVAICLNCLGFCHPECMHD